MKTIKIGRDSSNDITINEPRVSRSHAIISDMGNGTYEIKDLGSTNGTFVNGERISIKIMQPGDKLEVAGSIVNWYGAFTNQQSAKQLQIIQEKPYSKILKSITVGSAQQNDIVISDGFVSNQHAKISSLKNGNYFIQDLGSINGIFVNGNKVIAKNFTKTDVIKIATSNLPENWYKNKNLKPYFFRDHKRGIFIYLLLFVIITGTVLIYINRCKWFGWGCNLTAQEIYLGNQNSIVHIKHDYYYTIEANNKIYYVGKSKLESFVVEATTDKGDILPYNSVTGSGCFIKKDGTILTSAFIINPWFNKSEIYKMLQEVSESGTIKPFSLKKNYKICGETAELSWITNGTVNNPQNYVAARSTKECILKECILTDNPCLTIQSVQQTLPKNTSIIFNNYNDKSKDFKTPKLYCSVILPIRDNSIVKDTFYSVKYLPNLNRLSAMQTNIQLIEEGSIVLNERGELIGIVQQQEVIFINKFCKQINK